MAYYINLKEMGLERLRKQLVSRYLVPSRQPLRQDIDAIFGRFHELGLQHAGDLLMQLNTRKRLTSFSATSGVDEVYLTILGRELRSWLPKPNKIADFPEMDREVVLKLEQVKIITTLQLFEYILTPDTRKNLAEATGLEEQVILRLARLTDLSRIRWVSPAFAHMLLIAGFDCAQKVQRAHAEDRITSYNVCYTKLLRFSK